MSQPDLSSAKPRGVLVKKQPTNVYTVMLMIALLAMIIGCIFLGLELAEYGGLGKG